MLWCDLKYAEYSFVYKGCMIPQDHYMISIFYVENKWKSVADKTGDNLAAGFAKLHALLNGTSIIRMGTIAN